MTSNSLRSPALLALALLVAGAGCASSTTYVYRPTTPLLVDGQGQATAVYPIPPENPQGEVGVMSFGFVELETAPGVRTPTLHARLLVANNGEQKTLALDPRQVFLELPGAAPLAPTYANTDVGPVSVLNVKQGERRLIDFYFAVPGGRRDAGQLPAFDLRWQVASGDRTVDGRTPFSRLAVSPPPPPSPTVVVAGWGPFWWWHAPHLHPHFHAHRPLVIVRPHLRHHRRR